MLLSLSSLNFTSSSIGGWLELRSHLRYLWNTEDLLNPITLITNLIRFCICFFLIYLNIWIWFQINLYLFEHRFTIQFESDFKYYFQPRNLCWKELFSNLVAKVKICKQLSSPIPGANHLPQFSFSFSFEQIEKYKILSNIL